MDYSLHTAAITFALAGIVILIVGSRLAGLADTIADRTGIGEAIAGAVLLGATTSMSGIVTSVTAASAGEIDLAYSNALGGIAAQTLFLVVGDSFYRKANLEHAAADISHLTQATMLIVMLSVPLLAASLPSVAFFGVNPASVVLVVLYGVGVVLARRDHDEPMWFPRKTGRTRVDTAEDEEGGPSTTRLWLGFFGCAATVGVAGYFVATSGAAIARETGVGGSVVGALMTATVTSLPELVTTLAAVRRGALQLAVGGIIGGNTFDILFLSAADAAYRPGSLYHAVDGRAQFWAIVAIAMTGVLLLGLIRRERQGPGRIGLESATLIALYAGAALAALFGLRPME